MQVQVQVAGRDFQLALQECSLPGPAQLGTRVQLGDERMFYL